MACRYDPVVPSKADMKELGEMAETGQLFADRLVHLADILREEILADHDDAGFAFSVESALALAEAARVTIEAQNWLAGSRDLLSSAGFIDSASLRADGQQVIDTVSKLRAELNEASLDLIRLAQNLEIDPARLERVRAEQIEHRKLDLKRLVETFSERIAATVGTEVRRLRRRGCRCVS